MGKSEVKRYHINPKTGDPSICRAKLNCPFSPECEHFSNELAARKFFEREMEYPTHSPFSEWVEKLNELIPLGSAPEKVDWNDIGKPQYSLDEAFLKLSEYCDKNLEAIGSGEEKLVFRLPGTNCLVKIPAYEKEWAGISSMFDEVRASMFGFNKLKIAESRLVWSKELGLPLELQEELIEIKRHGSKKDDDEVINSLDWLPRFLRWYPQVGKNSRGDWVKFDIDVGDLGSFASSKDLEEKELAEIEERYPNPFYFNEYL